MIYAVSIGKPIIIEDNYVAKQVYDLAGRQNASVLFKLSARAVGSTSTIACNLADVDDLRVTCVRPNVSGVCEVTDKTNYQGDKYVITGDTALYCNITNLIEGSFIVTISGSYGSIPFKSSVVIVVKPNEQHTDISGISSVIAEIPVVEYIETPATPPTVK